MLTMISKVIALLIVMQVRFGRGYDNIIFEYLRLPEGSHCSWRGVDGVCASVYQCMSAMKDIGDKDYPPVCSFQGVKPIICCTDCELIGNDSNFTFQVINPVDDLWFFKTGEKARDYCLDYLHMLGSSCVPRVVYSFDKTKHPMRNCYVVNWGVVGAAGGQDANRDQYRHMVRKGPVRYAVLGILKRSDPQELWHRYHVKRIVRHPQYKPPSKYHDIALLETTTKVSFNIHVIPACLQIMVDDHSDSTASATGWGALGHNRELADTLQAVYLDQFEKHECARQYPPHRHLRHGINHDTQTCYGNRYKVKDTCPGDSGGPLQDNYYISDCVYTILGVTSSGMDCGAIGGSGIYTKVMPYLPWIESVVWPN